MKSKAAPLTFLCLSRRCDKPAKIKLLTLLVFWFITLSDLRQVAAGATVHVLSLSVAAVQGAIDSAADGDTIILPAGRAYWTNALNINRAITLRGAGVNGTVIINTQVATKLGCTGSMMSLNCNSNSVLRVTGFSFDGNDTSMGFCIHGPLWAAFRIDHCNFSHFGGAEVLAPYALLSGCVDHNVFIDNFVIECYADDNDANISWQLPLTMGTTNTVVFEDNVFLYVDKDYWGGSGAAVFAQGHGARTCFRHNTVTNLNAQLAFLPCVDAHGNLSQITNALNTPAAIRGTRQFELYNNTFVADAGYPNKGANPVHLRGGTIMMFSNVYLGRQWANTYYCQEEDGSSRFGWLSHYPGYDQHWLWLWSNTVQGILINYLSFAGGNDSIFLRPGTNVQFRAPVALDLSIAAVPVGVYPYTPLIYPHPLVNADDSNSSPHISITPSVLDFGSQAAGTSDLIFAVENSGGGVLTGFARVPAGPFTILGNDTYSLVEGQKCTITVRCTGMQGSSHISQSVFFTGGGGAVGTVKAGAGP